MRTAGWGGGAAGRCSVPASVRPRQTKETSCRVCSTILRIPPGDNDPLAQGTRSCGNAPPMVGCMRDDGRPLNDARPAQEEKGAVGGATARGEGEGVINLCYVKCTPLSPPDKGKVCHPGITSFLQRGHIFASARQTGKPPGVYAYGRTCGCRDGPIQPFGLSSVLSLRQCGAWVCQSGSPGGSVMRYSRAGRIAFTALGLGLFVALIVPTAAVGAQTAYAPYTVVSTYIDSRYCGDGQVSLVRDGSGALYN